MTTRIDVDINNTELLLGTIQRCISNGGRCLFLCQPGMGPVVLQRLRTKLARVRKSMREQGKPRQHFTLHHSIHPHTEFAQRYDAVVVWKTQSDKHKMTESLEDIIGHGGSI